MFANQELFLKDELFSLTLMATVQRAGVYRPDSPERKRKKFQSALQSAVGANCARLQSESFGRCSIQNILGLSTHLSAEHEGVLDRGRFRIGTAQKALNLYLKYLWCLGEISEPPHCPFDFQIIGTLRAYAGPSWTVLDTEQDYRNLVKAAKTTAQGASLAAWELETYNTKLRVPAASAASGRSSELVHSCFDTHTIDHRHVCLFAIPQRVCRIHPWAFRPPPGRLAPPRMPRSRKPSPRSHKSLVRRGNPQRATGALFWLLGRQPPLRCWSRTGFSSGPVSRRQARTIRDMTCGATLSWPTASVPTWPASSSVGARRDTYCTS